MSGRIVKDVFKIVLNTSFVSRRLWETTMRKGKREGKERGGIGEKERDYVREAP